MTDEIKQNYELSFHISVNLDEADVKKVRQDIENTVTSRGGSVVFFREPERTRLSYPIKHQSNAFFGYVHFNVESTDALVSIRDDLRLNDNVIRFLIIKLESESKTSKDNVARKMAAVERRKARIAKEKSSSQQKEAPRADEKKIDEKLEEIIEKL